jgi:outer membrane protein assembly factor BamB
MHDVRFPRESAEHREARDALPMAVGLLGRTAALLAFLVAAAAWSAHASARPISDDWPTSLHDTMRTGASRDTHISPANAARLQLLWRFSTGGPVATTPTIAGGIAYFGSWDGYEYAVNAATGRLVWKDYLGVLIADPTCIPPRVGPSSPGTVLDGTLYVGGADGYWYALDARTGALEWRVWTNGSGLPGVYDGHFNWAGPLIIGSYAYVGVASLGDCPLVQGQLLKISLVTHLIVATLNLVPSGEVGGGIWTSPAYDPKTGLIFTATGTRQDGEDLAQAVVAINAATMQISSFWPLPAWQEVGMDSDFSTSPSLIDTAAGAELVVAQNKNGYTYALQRNDLAAGPLWRQYVAVAGVCPTCGTATVSSGAFGAGRLYVAGNRGLIGNTEFPGTVRAEDPATGRYVWQHGAPGNVIGALAYDHGMVIDGGGSVLEVLAAKTGARLYSYDTGAQIYAGPSVAGGVIYTGNTAGQVLAFRLARPAGRPPGFRLITARAGGDVELHARIDAAHLAAGTQVGIGLRQSGAAGSPYYAVLAQSQGTVVRYRTAFRGRTSVLYFPASGRIRSLMILRHGDVLEAATSPNGRGYHLLPGASATVVMPARVLSGVIVPSGRLGSTVSQVGVGAAGPRPPSEPGAHRCPAGWSCADIGDPALVGDQTLAGGTWTLSAAGGDIWETSDQFHFVWRRVSSNGVVTARVANLTDTSPYAKAGVMIRAGTGAGAANYAVFVTPGRGLSVQLRYASGAPAELVGNPIPTVPAYVGIVRSGTTFSAETSSDGISWAPVAGSAITLPSLSGTLLGGLALTSHNTEAKASATFSAVMAAP